MSIDRDLRVKEREEGGLTQTTAEITLDLPAAVCVNIALERELDSLDRRLKRATNPEKIRSLKTTQRNVQAALDAFDPVYGRVLAAPLFTAAHEALIERALAKSA